MDKMLLDKLYKKPLSELSNAQLRMIMERLSLEEDYKRWLDKAKRTDANPHSFFAEHGGIRNTVIAHHGIPGMRWGVRRFQNPDGSLTPKGRARRERKRRQASDDSTRAKELNRQPVKTLSNTELRQLNERLNLEQQYRNLNSNTVSRGRKLTNKILSRVGNRALDKAVDVTIGAKIDEIFGG